MQMVQAQLDAALGALIKAGAPFDPAKTFLGVATAIVPSGLDTVLTDLTLATGAMSAPKPVTAWGPVTHLLDGRSSVEGPLMTFAPADSTEAQTLQAWYLADASPPTTLYAYGLIGEPVDLPDQFSTWSIVLRLTLDSNGQWSAEVTFNG